ncbi:MAG TPA: M20/M25/M40 family metallo-hydrolase [Myxococcota bacterium]|nr:M20/M25/M40 family metallo-hydrolase [Myxococcota bacterium]
MLSLGVLAPAAPSLAQDAQRTPRERLAREVYEELIEIDTSVTAGSTTPAAEAVAARLRAAGVPAEDVRVLGPSPRKGNLVARLRGSGAERPLLLLAHLDVVDARREDWSVDPFTLLERDGWFYGRGTMDDKAMAAIWVTLAAELARERRPLRRDVIVALTADEEGGPENGVEWLLREHRELVDAALVVNEGGGGQRVGGKRVLHAVQAAEKTYADFELVVRDKGGHSARPTPENAIYRLAAALGRLAAHRFPVDLNPVTRAYFERAARVEPGAAAADLAALAADPNDADAAERLSRDPSFNAQLRTTCVATRLEGGHANNALPQLARAVVNCRILPGHDVAEIETALADVAADPAVSVGRLETPSAPGPPAAVDPAFLGAVERLTEALWPGVPVVPTMSSGASDSRYFRSAGIPAYGVSGLFHDRDDVRAHGRDERLGVESFYEGLEFLGRLVHELAEATSG